MNILLDLHYSEKINFGDFSPICLKSYFLKAGMSRFSFLKLKLRALEYDILHPYFLHSCQLLQKLFSAWLSMILFYSLDHNWELPFPPHTCQRPHTSPCWVLSQSPHKRLNLSSWLAIKFKAQHLCLCHNWVPRPQVRKLTGTKVLLVLFLSSSKELL